MKRYLKDFNLTYEFVKSCVYDCLNKKRWKRFDTAYMLAECYSEYFKTTESLNDLAKRIRNQAYDDKTKLFPIVDLLASKMYTEIKTKNITLNPIMYQIRQDCSSGKKREIGISSMKQQCYDYVAVNACMKMFNAKICTYQCASIPNRGQLYGKKAIEKWVRKNPKACKYIVKCDVKKFYPSVKHEVIKKFLRRDIANDDILYLIFTLIDTYKDGLCIGSYLSQYLANYFLSYAYHYMDEQCYKVRRGKRTNLLKHKLLYMDDIFICGSRKNDVSKAFKILTDYLNNVLKLEIKDNYKVFELGKIPIDMMGYKIYQDRTTIRKRIFERLNKTYQKYKNKKNFLTRHYAYRIISYYGYIKHTDSFNIAKKLKVKEVLKRAKDVIRNEARNDNRNSTKTV